MMGHTCERAEILAGAIALGEATESERDEYRRHVAACASCLDAIGGERQIERTMDIVAQARTSEVWEPSIALATARRARTARAWGVGLSAAAFAFAVSLGIHAFVASQLRPVNIAAVREVKAAVEPMRITIEHRTPSQPVPTAQPPAKPQPIERRSFVIVHNVITLKHPVRNETHPPAASTQTTVIAETVPLKTQSDIPVWRRDEAMPHVVPTQPAPSPAPLLAGRAESIAVAPTYVIRDVAPLGGDAAINPRPPMIAYDIGAEGTTAFEVNVDEHGVPVKCTITKSSGYEVLDIAVCKAAMKARYSPRTINGRPVASIYRDAFTFHAENEDNGQL